jgi:arginine deiminase
MDRHDFVIDPLPNLLFTRDSSLWIRDHAAVTSLTMPARARETTLTQAIYRYHPRFAGTPLVYQPGLEHVEGGDVLLLAPGVIAVGVGGNTAAGAERPPSGCSSANSRTACWSCRSRKRATITSTTCTMVDVDAVVMYPMWPTP